MSLPLLHAGRTNPGLSAALDLRFALDKSLTAYRGPTPSFSRASTGSYFDGSGVLRYAVLNYLQYSEQFENAYWPKYQSSVTANAITAPDGKTTADKLVENSTNNVHGLNVTSFSTVIGQVYTLSVYAKAGERNWFSLNLSETGIADRNTWFNLANGTIGTNAAGNTPSITSVGNGWYRCSITRTMAVSNPMIFLELANADNTRSYLGDGTSGVYLWGAQLEASSTLGAYVQTTNAANSAPRFDHTFNGTSWVSRGLLVEEQRTNSSPYSVTFNSGNAPWGVADLSISLNSATAPDGTNTATKIIEGTGAGNHNIYRVFPFTGTITWSVFAKAAERNYIQIFIGNLNSPETGINVDLTNGAITNQSPSVVASGTQDVGNGWYRIWFSVTGSGGTYYPAVGTSNSATGIRSSYTGNGTSGVYIWGAQWESGNFPTSYIANSGSGSTTRSADVCQITGGDFSGFWNGTEGSIIAEADFIGVESANDKYIFSASNTTTPSNTFISAGSNVNSSGNFGSNGYISGAEQFAFSNSANPPANSPFKYALAIKQNDFASSYNGASVLSDASGNVTSVQVFSIGMLHNFGRQFCGHIARLRYYRKRLPNETLQLLSEPDPTLNLQFALNKTLTPVAGPAPSFSRASTGTFFNASGVLTSASINTPRFDHAFSGGQWVSRGLLLEEQRTNLAIYSEDLTNGVWVKANGATITADSTTAPDGNSTADRVNVTDPSHYIYKQNQSITNGVANTQTIYFKNGPGSNFTKVGFLSNVVGSYRAFVLNLSTGLTEAYPGIPFPSAYSATSIGNGWYRLSFTDTATGAAANCFYIDSAVTMATGSFYLWGAQVEAGSFATSYIPCLSSSSVTRSADVCQITGTSFNWMWNQGEGSFISECGVNGFNASGVNYIGVASVGSISQYAFVGRFNGSFTALNFQVYNGSPFGDITYTAVSATPTKTAFGIKANDCAASVNGGAILSDNTVTMTTALTQLEIGNFLGANNLNGHIAKLIYYPARLTNTKLQQLST